MHLGFNLSTCDNLVSCDYLYNQGNVATLTYLLNELLAYRLWQYGLWSFQTGYTKLERFLHKNQHTQRKLLLFENWTNGEPQ